MRHLLLFLLLALTAHAQQQPGKVTIAVDPNPLPPGQQGLLTLRIEIDDVRMGAFGVQNIPLALPPGLQMLGFAGNQMQMDGQRAVIVQQYGIVAPQPGTYLIAEQQFEFAGRTFKTKPLTVTVNDNARVQAPNVAQPGQDNGLGAEEPILQLDMRRTEFFVGEIVPITATVYLPRLARRNAMDLRQTGLIEVEKSDVAIRRFPQNFERTEVNIGGQPYLGGTFRSTLSAMKAGKLTVGPAKAEVVVERIVMRSPAPGFPAFPDREAQKLALKSNSLSINVLDLPAEGKPANFAGAVGEFTLTATASTQSVTVGEPVPVDLVIEGTGNFDSVSAPELVNGKGWKAFPPKRYNVDATDPNTADLANRRVGFNQVLVPEEVSGAIPPFELSFFNPTTRQYSTLRSQALPITIKPPPAGAAPTAVVEGSVPGAPVPASLPPPPQADITDILVTIPATAHWAQPSTLLLQSRGFLWGNAIALGGLVALVSTLSWQRYRASRVITPEMKRAAALRDLEHHDGSGSAFYRDAAAWLMDSDTASADPEAQAIIAKHEALNYSGTTSTEPALSKTERLQVLAVLHKLAVIVLIAMTGSAAATPDDAYATAAQALRDQKPADAFNAAIPLVKEGNISPELFTVLGHASYKNANYGTAAIWYQRAQVFPNPSPELRQNVRHLRERMHFFGYDSDTPLRTLSRVLSRNGWIVLGALGAWMIVLGLAGLIMTKKSALSSSLMGIGLLVASVSVFGYTTRPSYDDVKPLAFVIAPQALAHTAATQTSGSVIAVPHGSIVTRLEERGNWSYIEIPQEGDPLRGWLATNQLEAFWPYDPSLLP